MRIEQIELRHIRMPWVHPFETSFGRETHYEGVIAAVSGEGLTGWGECPAGSGPWYSYETAQTAWHVMRDFLVPLVLGQEAEEAEEVAPLMARVRGHNMAKAGIEMACWDLLARTRGVSLSQYLGGTRDRVKVGVSVGIQESLEALVARVGSFLDEGYPRIKIKIKPGWDVEAVKAVRAEFGDILLQVDANSAYTLDDLPMLKALDGYELLLIEQPLGYDDLYDHAKVQRELETPVCLDESIHSPDHARWALELGSCQVINIKPARVGGLRASKCIHDLCQESGVPVWCGGMLETGIGRATNVALASLPNFGLPGDISATARYYAHDIAQPPFELNADGTLTVPTGPGIGVEMDVERLEQVTLRHEVFTSNPR